MMSAIYGGKDKVSVAASRLDKGVDTDLGLTPQAILCRRFAAWGLGKRAFHDVLRHRVILTYEAEAEEMTSEDVIKEIFDRVEVP